jgi:hypothetical protein
MPGVLRFGEYLRSLKSPGDFSGPKLLDIMSSFQQPFEKHMVAEVALIANFSQHAQTPKEGSEKETEVSAAFQKTEGMALMMAGVTDVLPFFLFNFDGEFEGGIWKDWPPIPGVVRWGVMSLAKTLHGGWWKFACCDAERRRKELFAVPKVVEDSMSVSNGEV